MAIASLHRRSTGPTSHRVERRGRKRIARTITGSLIRAAIWILTFFGLGWLLAAGFYGLLVNV